MSAPYWVYILYCHNNTYYTGYTTDLIKRFHAHRDGTAKCKYTRSFKPLYVAQCWPVFDTKNVAMKMERRIKKMSRTEKEKLIYFPENYFKLLYEE